MPHRTALLALAIFLLAGPAVPQQTAQTATHTLKPTPATIAWGYYDASTPPVLRIKSGDSVEIQTLITSSPKRLEGAGLRPELVEQPLRDIYEQVKEKGPGGHILTGPIYIEDARRATSWKSASSPCASLSPTPTTASAPAADFCPKIIRTRK